MTWRTEERPVKWLPYALMFLLGLLIGWWIIGWWLWPVSYTNALPQDLRADEKGQYLVMTADSYATTGDLALAQKRTESWPRDQLARDLTGLQARLTGENPTQADHLQRLASALKLSAAPAQAPGQAPAQAPAPAQSPSLLQRICPGALWILLVVAALLLFLWLFRQWQRRTGQPGLNLGGLSLGGSQRPAAPPAPPVAPGPSDIAEEEEERWEPSAREADTGGGWEAIEPTAAPYDEPAAPSGRSVSPGLGRTKIYPTMDDAAEPGGPARPVDAPPAAAAAAVKPAPASGPMTKVGDFVAAYHAGEPDYDEAFDVKDTAGAVIGQCGLSLMMPVGRGSDQAAALQVWLWEEKDQYTQVKVLMSESAYRDTALRDQLAEENPPVPVRPGTEFDLETHRLLMRGTVEGLAYEEGEVSRIFNHLAVRLRVYQKERS